MFCLSVLESRQHAADGYPVRHQSTAAQGLRNAGAGARLFRQFRSVWRLRFDLRRGETESEDHRNSDPLQGAHVRRNTDLAIPRRLAAAEDGMVRISQTQGHLIANLQ